jgi:DNA-directed RNA polymerase specialized sigma24 family protein
VTVRADAASDYRTRFEAEAIPYMRQMYAPALRLTRHRCVCRKRSRISAELLAADVDEAAHDHAWLPPAASSAETQALEGASHSAVMRALGELPPQFKTVIYLADIHSYRYASIAALTGAPLGTVMSRIHRGRQMLRPKLARPGAAV